MKNQFLEAGQIVNTHGIQGEVKIVPWCDSPEFLLQFDTLYLDGTPVRCAPPGYTRAMSSPRWRASPT
ncbi:MAG: hypothetical protein V8S11_11880 [Flavonifractor plautii]